MHTPPDAVSSCVTSKRCRSPLKNSSSLRPRGFHATRYSCASRRTSVTIPAQTKTITTKKSQNKNIPNIKGLLNALINSPASRGIIGVLLAYLFHLDEILGNYLWIPARIVIALAIIIVGTRLGIITNQKGKIFDLNEEIKFSILLKLFILPFIVFLISKFLNFDFYQSSAVILQAGTPTAISTILMAEAYDVKQKIASKILFTTTLISIFTIPLLKILLNAVNQNI